MNECFYMIGSLFANWIFACRQWKFTHLLCVHAKVLEYNKSWHFLFILFVQF